MRGRINRYIFIIGFTKHGFSFLKYGLRQNDVVSSFDRHFAELSEKIISLRDEVKADIGRFETRFTGVETRVAGIETNHFRRLKNFLTELTSILLDKGVINNQDKARLDNQLRDV